MNNRILDMCVDLIEQRAEYAPPEVILALRPTASAQDDMERLNELNQGGELSSLHQLELEQSLELERVIVLLKSQALQVLHARDQVETT
ncbi:MAG: hypothetical protein SGI73_08655 [Chloroflexota bacterium]|nr:hypothetical protein [Chloroflexota bacterium]